MTTSAIRCQSCAVRPAKPDAATCADCSCSLCGDRPAATFGALCDPCLVDLASRAAMRRGALATLAGVLLALGFVFGVAWILRG